MIHLLFLKKFTLVDLLNQRRRYVRLPIEQSMLCQEQGRHILSGISMGKIKVRNIEICHFIGCHKSNKSQD